MDSSAKLLTESKRNSLRKAILSLLSEWMHFDEQLACINQFVESREGISVSVQESGTKELMELVNKQFEPINELIGEKLKVIDSKEAYFENRAKELDLVEDSVKRRAQLLDLKENELKIREGGLDFSQNFVQERAKELEAQQKLIDERVRELELKEKEFINVKTERFIDISENEGSQGALPRSNVGKSSTAAVTSGSNWGRSVFCQQEDVPTGEAVKVCTVISERILGSHLRPEADSNSTLGSDPVTMAGGVVEIGGSLKNRRKEVGHVTTEDVNGSIGMPEFRGSRTSRNINRKRARKLGEVYNFMSSSIKSCKSKSSSDGKQVQTPEPLGAEKLKVGNSAGIPSAANADEEDVKRKGSASTIPVLLYENGSGKHQVNIKEDVTLDPNAKNSNVVDDSEYTFNLFNRSDPTLYDYPDPEFSNFDKDKEERCFSARQIWAVYDTIDSMPRFYAEIMKVLSPEFKLLISWLDADPEDQSEIEWVDNGLSVACGKFKRSMSEETSDRLMFSHQIHFERGSSRGYYGIYPRKGETWAVFKDWDIRWSSDPENHKKYFFEIVEILTGYVHDTGIRVAYLEKIKGFVGLFQRMTRGEIGSILIPSSELLRFSHRIPSFKMTGSEREGVPEGSFELDPAALPIDLIKSPDVCPTFTEEVFGKFDREKSKSKFQPGQIWALYSCKDGMPKTYAQIKKIESSPFKLHAALLEPSSRLTQPVCCGIFEVQHRTIRIFPPSSFSHEVKVGYVCENIYGIFPREGEIWAIYKNWNAELSFSDMENCEYEIVEILKNEDYCIEVSCLVPLTGVKWIFMAPRRQKSNSVCLEIRRGELARFSHQIPVIQLIGENHCWELDPASVPGDLFHLRSCSIERPRKRPR